MARQHFFLKLISPRATFPADMMEREKELLQGHSRHMAAQFAAGKVLVYGPVMAVSGASGAAVWEVADEAEARGLVEADPWVSGSMVTFELSAMRVSGAQSSRARGA
jgi:uncharacterized protein YciI